MKLLYSAGAAAIALALAPATSAMAQDTAHEMHLELKGAHKVAYDSWPPERRLDYDGWDAEYQKYFWTLTPAQQEGWWVLTEDQRVRVYEMTPDQRAAAWKSITAQVSGDMPAAASANASAQARMNSRAGANASTTAMTNIRFETNPTVQNAPAAKRQGEYPICQGDIQDSCINPWEAGKKWGNKPLDYWPGKPASEMKRGKR